MDDKYHIAGLMDYEIDTWLERLGAIPTAVVDNHDRSEGSYEMDKGMVLKLANGQFALITESGCSCYEASDANIDLFPSEAQALMAFKIWKGE